MGRFSFIQKSVQQRIREYESQMEDLRSRRGVLLVELEELEENISILFPFINSFLKFFRIKTNENLVLKIKNYKIAIEEINRQISEISMKKINLLEGPLF